MNHRKHVCKLVHVQLTTSTQIPLFPGASQKDHRPWERDAFSLRRRLRSVTGALTRRTWHDVRSARREEELYFSPSLVSLLAQNAAFASLGSLGQFSTLTAVSCFVQKVRFHSTISPYAVSCLLL